MIRHLVWDWNGTLLDDRETFTGAVNAAMTAVGLPPVTTAELRIRFARPLRELFRSVSGLSDGRLEELWPRWHDAFSRHESGALRLAADAHAAVAAWAQIAGGTQSVVSWWPDEQLRELVPAAGLVPPISHIRGARHDGDDKAGMVRELVRSRGLDPAEVAMVGDTTDDAEAATAVGARAVLCDVCSFSPVGDTHHLTAPNLTAAITLIRTLP